MKKLFTLLTLFVSVFALFATLNVKEADAAAGGTVTLKLTTSNWGSASAYYTIHYWGGDTSTSWPGNKFNGGKAASGNVEITANYDETSTHCIIIRWGNSACSTEWNRWDYFDTNTMSTKYNYFTNTAWDSCDSKYVASVVEKEKYTYTYYDGSEVLGTETLVEGDTWGYKFYEKEGYKLEGWYTDSSLTTAYAKGTVATANKNLYAKYVAAEDYTVYVNDNGVLGETAYAYLFNSVDGRNNSWPGVEMTKESNGLWSYTIDASKSFDMIIFGNGKNNTATGWAQTANLDLSNVEDKDTFVFGSKDSSNENKYNATLEKTGAANNLNELLSGYYNEGVYTKNTTIYLNETAVNEFIATANIEGKYSGLFHAGVTNLERITYYNVDELWMTNEEGTINSGYGTSAEGMTHFSKDSEENKVVDYTVAGTTMVDYYIGLEDIVATTDHAWSCTDSVYTTTDDEVIGWFKAFVAPCFTGFDAFPNFITLTSVSVSVDTDGNLVLSLYAASNTGMLTSEGGLFAQAIIPAIE